MLRLEKVNGKNVWDILKLKVSESQRNFVAPNDVSIIEAYTAITANGYAFPFGLYDGDKPVGFLMIGFDIDDYWDDAPEIARGNYNLWRLMIDESNQRNGYGKEAVKLALEFINSIPCGKAEYCWLSYEPENEAARHLYSSFGFVETGEMDAYGHRKLGGIGMIVAEAIKRRSNINIMYQQVGYMMRSGAPDSLDRMVATSFGHLAAQSLMRNDFGRMVALHGGKYTTVPVSMVLAGKKIVDVPAFYDIVNYRPHIKDFLGVPMFLS